MCVCVNLSIHAADSSSPDSTFINITSARSPFLCALFKQCSLTHLLPPEGGGLKITAQTGEDVVNGRCCSMEIFF